MEVSDHTPVEGSSVGMLLSVIIVFVLLSCVVIRGGGMLRVYRGARVPEPGGARVC